MKTNIMRIVVLALLLYALTGFTVSLRAQRELKLRMEALRGDIAAMQAANDRLCARIEDASGDEAMEALARERLALVMPGEKIFYFGE